MLEKTVETYLVDRVRAAGGDAYKFTSPARVSVPDRIVVFPPARIYFVELKRPGGKLTRGQEREHARLRALGCDVRTLDSREAVDAFVRGAAAAPAAVAVVEKQADYWNRGHFYAGTGNVVHPLPGVQRLPVGTKLYPEPRTASPVEQPAAAPINTCQTCGEQKNHVRNCNHQKCFLRAPTPADERAAFEAWAKTKNMDLTPFETTFDSDFTSNAWDGWQARASSANETDALGYAQRLATSLWQQHWRDTAPQWKVLDDTLGVLTQIDNMVCGLRRAPALTDAQREAIAFAAGWFNQSVLPDTPYGGYVAALRELLAGGAA